MSIVPNRGVGVNHRPLLRRDIVTAQLHTQSNAEAARYLNVSFETYRKYARMYDLYEQHKNQGGKGQGRPKMKGAFGLDAILRGEHPTYNVKRLKQRVIGAGLLAEECALCGFNTRRNFDNRCPLVLHMLDGDSTNHRLANLQLRCYNCTYLTTGKINDQNLIKPGVTDADMLEVGGLTMADIEDIQNEFLNQTDEE